MEEQYWKRFIETGKIDDYLFYKGISLCADIMERRKEENSESDHRYRNGTPGRTNW